MTLRWRGIWVASLGLIMLYLALPSFFSDEERLASDWIRDEGLNLGLDLQGGIHWLLRIDTQTAVRQEMKRVDSRLRELMEERELEVPETRLLESNELEVAQDSPELRELIGQEFPSVEIESQPGVVRLSLTDDWHQRVVERGVLQALEVLRKRVDGLGIREPVIAPQGDDRILVQMPGEIDPRRARGILEETTFLEFKLVLASAPNEDLLRAQSPEAENEDNQIVLSRNDDGTVSTAYLLPATPLLTGAMLEDARLAYDRRNQPVVSFTWNSEGTQIFRDFTASHIDRQLAIIVDEAVISAPVIQGRIGRVGEISGRFTAQEAADLAVALRSGALPIPLIVEEERSVGPALGADSIRKGLNSIMVGGLGVVIFMVVYYQTCGALANVALILNLVIILGMMGLAGATLTLPGIAGLVLTVGMAVDANVIIFERIREEMRAGKSVRNAVQVGFRRSRLTILDANITTMIAAVVLLYYGRGPVQGFGVTLAIGIVSSVFCALVVTRLLVDGLLARGAQTLRI